MQVLVGFIMLAAFLSFPLFTEYNFAWIKVDRLADCIALKVVGAVLVIFFRRWRTICTVFQSMGNKG
jgi:hypothetical protein